MYVSFEYVVSTYIHDQHPKSPRGLSLVALISADIRADFSIQNKMACGAVSYGSIPRYHGKVVNFVQSFYVRHLELYMACMRVRYGSAELKILQNVVCGHVSCEGPFSSHLYLASVSLLQKCYIRYK